jgi:glycolate oxidase
MKKPPFPRWLTQLTKTFPTRLFRTDPATLELHSKDGWFATAMPQVVAFPRTKQDVSALLAFASQHRIPVTPRGAGRGYVGSAIPVKGGIALSSEKLDRILELSPTDAVAIVQPGVNVGHLKASAEAVGFTYPPDPASFRDNSIGGNIATNAGGPRCLKYGVTKHYVLGLEVVLPNGTIVQTGGRTHKNKVGFDLTSLFIGSEGMLGFVTEATLRLIPTPPQRAVIVAAFANAPQAAATVGAIFQAGFLPAALEIADALTLRAARAYTKNVPPGDSVLLIEIDGQRGAVASDLQLLLRLLKKCQPTELRHAIGQKASARLWNMRKDFSYSLRATGLTKLNEDVTVPRGKLLDLFLLSQQLEKKYGIQVGSFGHAGDGNIHVNLMVEPGQATSPNSRKALDDLFRHVIQWGGAISGEHGIGLAKKPWWPAAVSPELHQFHLQIKKSLDPLGIMNPGKFLDP